MPIIKRLNIYSMETIDLKQTNLKALCEMEDLLIVSNCSISTIFFNIRLVSRKGFSYRGNDLTLSRLTDAF